MEWKEVTLGEITNLVIDYRGKTPLKLGSSWSDSGYRALSAKNIKTGQIVAEDSIRFVDEELYRKWMKDEVNRGDILITSEAPFGQIYYWDSDEKIVLSQRLFDVRLNDEVCHKYVYYFMTSHRYQKDLEGRATGTTVTGLRQPELLKSTILLPPLSAQRSIASILSSLDRKIELNNKINADLEEMAQAIFKNWFVDFEPFKDCKFVDSELGMIPEGWKVGTIGDIVEFQNGFTFSSKDFSENGEYKIITIKSVQDGCLVTEGSSKVTEYPTKMPAYCKLQSGDILLSLTGNVGRCCLVTETNLLLNQRVAKIKAKECYDNSFSYALFRLKETKELLISISRGTAQANLSPVEASKLPMVIPSEDARKSFSMISDSIMNKIISIHIENSRLSLLRDTLLPRLMSGEIEVPE